MGGLGSGLPRGQKAKKTTGDYKSINIYHWRRERLLNPGGIFELRWLQRDGNGYSLYVRVEAEQIALSNYPPHSRQPESPCFISLSWMPCHFGGKRPFFICPGCNQQAAILYNRNCFACRRCHRLTYRSQRRLFDGDHAWRQSERIRRKLGWPAGGCGDIGPKPKGMWQKTFDGHTGRYISLIIQSQDWVQKKIPLLAAGQQPC